MTPADHANTATDALDTLSRIVGEHTGLDKTTGGWYAITKIRESVAALQAQAVQFRRHVDQLLARAVAAEAALRDCEEQFAVKYERMVAAEAERERLRDALRPFAATTCTHTVTGPDPDGSRLQDKRDGCVYCRARAALTHTKQP